MINDVINVRLFRNICEESYSVVVNVIFLFSCSSCNMSQAYDLAEL